MKGFQFDLKQSGGYVGGGGGGGGFKCYRVGP